MNEINFSRIITFLELFKKGGNSGKDVEGVDSTGMNPENGNAAPGIRISHQSCR
jgi:hypothetical protein